MKACPAREEALALLAVTPVPHNAVAQVSCRKKWYSRTSNHKFNVVAVDCGIKLNIIRSLNQRGCNVTVVPYNTSAEEIRRMDPDGIFLSNGPGDPQEVKNLKTGRLEITSQNHSYAVDEKTLAGTGLTVTHVNLLDGTVEGVESVEDRIFSVQYHPESAPGPQDSTYLFDQFLDMMKEAPHA